MNRIHHLIFTLLAIAILTACSQGEADHTLTVSIEPQRYLLEQIAGDKWQVNTVLEKGADPENFDPPMSTMKKAMNSRLYFSMGTLPFEQTLIDRMNEGGEKVKTVDTSAGIRRLHGTHGPHDGHHHESAEDPHVWTSVVNSRQMARNMLDALVELDPDNSDYYNANYRRLDARLDSIDREIRTLLEPCQGATFVVWHPSLSYFAADYGLNQVAMGMENKEVSPMQMKENIDRARTLGARVMIVQPDFDQNRSAELARQIGATTLSVNLMSDAWIDDMLRTARTIAGQPAE